MDGEDEMHVQNGGLVCTKKRVNSTILRKEDGTKDVKPNKTNSGRQIACILSNAASRYKFASL